MAHVSTFRPFGPEDPPANTCHVHVVEVKTRSGTVYGSPLEAIGGRKQEHLRRSTMTALAVGIPSLTRPMQGVHIDAISVLMSDGAAPCIEFLEDTLA